MIARLLAAIMLGSLIGFRGVGSYFFDAFDLFPAFGCFSSLGPDSMSEAKLKPSSLKQF